MNNYEIVVDSNVDLSKELRERFNIHDDYLRGVVYLNNEEFYGDMDWNNMSPSEFFNMVKKNVGKMKTAFPPYEEFERVIAPLLSAGKGVILFAMSSGMSGTYNAYRQYADLIKDSYPNAKIVIIDTLKYCSASGLLVIKAAQNRDEKHMSLLENEAWLNENKYCLHEIGPMDDLRFLAKSGRLTMGKAFFGQLVGVQPVADFTREGLNVPLATVKGEDKALQASLEYMKKTIINPREQIIVLAHSDRASRVEKYKKLIEENLKPAEIIVASIGQSSGVNIGPGLCVAFYFGKPLSENREEENAIFKEIIGK